MSIAISLAILGALVASGCYWYGENHPNNEPYGEIPLVLGFLAGSATCVVSLFVAFVIWV